MCNIVNLIVIVCKVMVKDIKCRISKNEGPILSYKISKHKP